MAKKETKEVSKVVKEALSELKFKGYDRTVALKRLWLQLFPKYNYHHQETCNEVGIIRSAFYKWKMNDDVFNDEYLRIYMKGVSLGLVIPRKIKPKRSPEKIKELKKKFLLLYNEMKLSPEQVCKELGISNQVFREWKRDTEDKDFKETYALMVKAKQFAKGFVPGKGLPTGALKKANEQVIKYRKIKQQIFLECFKATYFNIGLACETAGVQRQTFSRWMNTYPEFKEAFDSALETKKDFIEDKLMKNIDRGDSSCIIFASETKLRDRGYNRKQEIEHSGNFGVMVVPGKIEDAHDWALKATKQQQQLAEQSMETEYIHELEE